MPKLVCRIKRRPGLPLGLSIYPCVTFLDFPREIRDQVYHNALIAPESITVWSGTKDFSYNETLGKQVLIKTYTIEAKDPVLDSLATSLFRCNNIVAQEALEIFYRYNTFNLAGHEIWNPMYTWLSSIGKRNRQHVQTIKANLPIPEPLRVDRYGTRTFYGAYGPFQRVHSFVDVNTTLWDRPHCLDPAIEACFRILGESGSRLKLRLWTGRCLPGVVLWEDEQVQDAYRWGGMEIPNEIERVRKIYASHINVLWQCQGKGSEYIEQKELIQRQGWKIIDEKHGLYPEVPYTYVNSLTKEKETSPQAVIIQYSLSRGSGH